MKTTRTINPRWMSLRDFAIKYDINIRTAQRYAENGKLPCKKMGAHGAWYIDLEKWDNLVDLYRDHEESTQNVVTGQEYGMRVFKLRSVKNGKDIIEEETPENKINEEDQ